MNEKMYEYDEIIHCIPEKGGAYVIFPVEYQRRIRQRPGESPCRI